MSYNRKALSKAKLDLDKYKKPNPYKKDIIYTEQGQWKFPGQKTRIPSSDITMQGVPYPVFAQPNIGKPQMMYPGQEYNFPGADYVDETPMAKKGGLVQMPKPTKKGLASKKYSRSLSATNKLFTENPLFKKPKSKKRKVFDPNAKYYQDGGLTYNALHPIYQSALQNFVYPEIIDLPEETDTERYGYDAALGVIKQNPNDPIANVNNPWWREHELFHHLQNQAGAMSTYGTVGLRPNPYVASDEAIGAYYDRRGSEFDIELNKILEQNPDISEEEALAIAEENLYRNPKSVEGEARDYEGYIEAGNPSIFPKKQTGGALPEDYSQFQSFAETLPSNLQDPNFEYGNPDQYNLYGMWETVGKPQTFQEVQDSDYFPLQDDDTYHGFTVGSNGEFLKPMSHNTTWKEVMNSQLNTDPYFQQNRIIRNEQGRLQYVPNEDYIEAELTPEEIEQYTKGGYVVEEVNDPSIPALNTYAPGGATEQKIIFSPKEGGCPKGEYWTGTECKKIPPNTKIVYSQKEYNKLTKLNKLQNQIYNDALSVEKYLRDLSFGYHETNQAHMENYLLRPVSKSELRKWKSVSTLPKGWENQSSEYLPGSIMQSAYGANPWHTNQRTNVQDYFKKLRRANMTPKQWFYTNTDSTIDSKEPYVNKAVGMYPVFDKPSQKNYILGYTKEEEPIVKEPIVEELKREERVLEEMQPLKPSLINQQLDLGPREGIIEEDLPPTYTPSGDDYIIRGYKQPSSAKRIQRKTNFNPDYYTDYLDEEGNYIEGEVTKAEKENRRVDFSGGATTRKDLKAQKEYNKAYDEYEKIIKQKELERKFIESQIDLSAYFKNGGDVSSEFIKLELDDNEIQKYVDGGYIVEELPEMQPGGTFKPGTGYKMPTLSKSEMATVKKEVVKAKPVAVSKPVAKKQSTSSFADRAAQVNKENKLKGIENISVDEATYNANRDRQNMQHLSEAISGVGEITGINSAIRTGERIVDDPLKFADDLTTGISQVPETLVEGAMTLGSKLFGDNKDYVDVDTDALGVFTDVVGALPLIGTAGKVAKPVIKSAKLKEFFNRPPGPLMLGLGSGTKTPKTIPNFESEIDWVNWVKKHNKNYDAEDIQNVIKNSEEYNIIEQQTKANGTWMTNADGTPFQGTPEQFIQQQSTKFKQAYPEGTEITYRGGDKSDALKSDWSDKSKVVFTTKDEYGARAYNRTLDEPAISLTEAPPEGISQLYMPQTTNKIVIDGNIYPIGHKNRKYGLPYIDDKGKEVIDPAYRTNYARLNAIDQVPANELEAQNLEAFKNWMLEKHPTMTERGWSGEPRILNDWVMTDHFADFLNSPAGKDISRVEFQKIMDGTLKPIDVEVHNLNKAQQLKSRWGNSGEFDLTNPNKFKALLPYIIPTGLGTGAAAYGTSENNTEPQNKKGGNINNYAPGGELSPKDLDPATLEKYLSDLRDLENSIKKGYKNNKWYPHSSIEGGANTIAYGHKLKPGESFASGLTEQQARDLQKKDVLVHQAKAEEYVDKKYGTGTYDKLPQNSQMMLTDYAYNLGSLNPFPSFVEGVVKGDKNKMLQQYERRGLSERNKWTQNVINTTDFSKGSDEGFFDWLKTGWWNKKNGGAIEMDIKNKEDLKRYVDQGYIIEEL